MRWPQPHSFLTSFEFDEPVGFLNVTYHRCTAVAAFPRASPPLGVTAANSACILRRNNESWESQ